MKNGANDNERFSFITLAASTANVVRYLNPNEKQNEDARRDSEPGDGSEKKTSEDRAYIDHRLKEIAAWERKISGRKL